MNSYFHSKEQVRRFFIPRHLPNDELQRGLDAHHPYGDTFFNVWRYHHRKRINLFCRLLDSEADNILQDDNCLGLDIGCGRGPYSIISAKRKIAMVSVELDRYYLNEAAAWQREEGVGNISLIQGDATTLPFRSNCFDFIICSEVLEHLPDAGQGAVEVHRVLKPGGRAIFNLPNAVGFYWLVKRALETVWTLRGKGEPEWKLQQHWRFPFWKTIKILQNAGFRVSKTGGTCLLPIPTTVQGILAVKAPRVFAWLDDVEEKLEKTLPFKFLSSFLFLVVRKG